MTCQLYRHFDAAGDLLYVGISLSAVSRLSQHKNSAWFAEIKRVEIEHYPTRDEALDMEALAIRNENPRYNKFIPFESRPDIFQIIKRVRQTMFHDKDVMDLCDATEELMACNPTPFDRKAYMRDYMKQRRKKEKAK